MKELLGIAILFIVFASCGYFVEVESCNALQEESKLETKHEFWNGCFVKIDGKWVPQKNWKVER